MLSRLDILTICSYKDNLLRITFLLLVFFGSYTQAQDAFQPIAIGFYNVENLFDTKNDTLIDDEEFLPEGKKAWTQVKYEEKVANVASVVSQLGKDLCPDGLSLLGVSEIENEGVLLDVISHPLISGRNYGVLHHESKDKRGIDVSLIYYKDIYEPISQKAYFVDIFKEKDTDTSAGNDAENEEADSYKRYTRDVVLYTGLLAGEKIHLTVNHWPSRSGGEKRSEWKRKKAALVNRHILDSLLVEDPQAKFIVMGDLNDDPSNKSLTSCMVAKKKYQKVKKNDFFNPMYEIYDSGQGTTAYRDRWSLFDQIIVSHGLLRKSDPNFHFQKAVIYKKKYLIQPLGKYKGYPKRTFNFDVYQGGYSDHLPVIAYLLKAV